MNRHSAVALILLTLSGLCVTGCAFGTRRVALTYPPDAEIAKDGSVVLAAEHEAKPANGLTVALQKFRDERSDKVAIGEVRNGYGMQTSVAVAENDVAEWVTDAIRFELEREGFVVMTDPAAFEDTTTLVSGDVITVSCKAMFSYEGEVSFYGTISDGRNELHKERYTAKGTAGLNWAARAESYGKSLADALQQAVRAFVVDIDEAARSSPGTPVKLTLATSSESPEQFELPEPVAASVAEGATRVEDQTAPIQTDDVDLYNTGRKSFDEGHYAEASEKFESYLRQYPHGNKAADASYWLAHSRFRDGKFEESAKEFDSYREVYPAGDKITAALHNGGVAYAASGNNAKAIELFTLLIGSYPNDPNAKAAELKLRQLQK
jgi:tol-pal system protein YbgF